MKRSTPLARKTRIRPRNPKRAAKRRAEAFGEQAEVCRRLACVACAPSLYGSDAWLRSSILAANRSSVIVSQAHHEPPRSCGGSDADCVPLGDAGYSCHHHSERHAIGRKAFEAKYSVDLRAIAARIAEVLAP